MRVVWTWFLLGLGCFGLAGLGIVASQPFYIVGLNMVSGTLFLVGAMGAAKPR